MEIKASEDGQQQTPQASDSQVEVKTENEKKQEKPTTVRKRKKKLEIACVYCRRSHMICDESRPCQRCIKRGILHLCYDEPSNPRQRKKAASLRKSTSDDSSISPPAQLQQQKQQQQQQHDQILSQPQHSQQQQQQQHQQQLHLVLPVQHAQSGEQHPNLAQSSQATSMPVTAHPQPLHQQISQSNVSQPKTIKNSVLSQTFAFNQEPLFYSEHAGSEFSSLNDFLSMIDDPELVNGALNDDPNGILNFGIGNSFNVGGGNSNTNLNNVLAFSPNTNMFGPTFPSNDDYQHDNNSGSTGTNTNGISTTGGQLQQNLLLLLLLLLPQPQLQLQLQQHFQHHQLQPQHLLTAQTNAAPPQSPKSEHPPIISDSARDKFFLTAADPTTEISPEERLKQVIKAKLEAGLLQPYNYAKGYARLQRYMDNYMNISSRQRILKPLSIFRPAFRAIARTLKDVDLVLVEESFERMLLDYDRVFTSMAIPACLWRRTGEIYRGNKEFASLVGVTTDDLKDGKLAIYELMSEESAVNFWEKYGAIAFDKGQKAVLTSCNLRTKDGIKRKSCCFSFTIRRDRYNIPSCIVGNFIPIDP